MSNQSKAAGTNSDATLRGRITAVSGFKSSDGTVFEDESKALQHEGAIVRKAQIEAFCENYMCRDMSPSDVAELLLQHMDELRNIVT